MARGKRLTEQQVQEIGQQYSVKKRVAEVAKSLGLSKTSVTTHLQKLGVFSKAERSTTLTNEQTEEIVCRYQKGESAKKIARSLNVASSGVVKLLKSIGILRTKSKLGYYKSLTSEKIQKIVQMYQEGLSSNKIAVELNVSNDLILKHLHLLGIPIRKASFYRKGLTPEQIAEICKRYKEGYGVTELASLYKTTITTLKKLLANEGLTISRKKTLTISRKKLSLEQQQQVIDLCEKGELFSDIATKFGVSHFTIRRVVKTHSVSQHKSVAGLKPNQVSEICQLYEESCSIHKLAQRYRVSDHSIKKLLISKDLLR